MGQVVRAFYRAATLAALGGSAIEPMIAESKVVGAGLLSLIAGRQN
jgi:hypothetical protein